MVGREIGECFFFMGLQEHYGESWWLRRFIAGAFAITKVMTIEDFKNWLKQHDQNEVGRMSKHELWAAN